VDRKCAPADCEMPSAAAVVELDFQRDANGKVEDSSRNNSESKRGRENIRPIVGETDHTLIEMTFGGRCAVRRKLQEKRAPKRNLQCVFALCKGAVPFTYYGRLLTGIAAGAGGRLKPRSRSAGKITTLRRALIVRNN
jgi:hypothetical protein